MESFHFLVNELKQNGYKVKVLKENGYEFALVSGKGIEAGFCTPHERCNPYLNGKIAADNASCFDKWSKCPLNLPLPETKEQMEYLLDQLEYWSSEDGYRLSNEYHFNKWVKEYPIGI